MTALTVTWNLDAKEGAADALCLGRPNTNVHAYVVDSGLRPVPPGVPGELLLSGPRLGRGYIGRPDLTEEKWIPNPCHADYVQAVPLPMRQHFRKAYRTGDLVRWRPDGNLDYLGRIDRQVSTSV